MKITVTSSPAGTTIQIKIHPFVLKHHEDAVAELAVRLMVEYDAVKATVSPSWPS